MKLLHDDIISLLANALNIKKVKAEELLAEWVLAIRKEVEQKGNYHADGLGTFVLADDGKLEFKPEEKLAIEVNYKYAGMNPIEILPAYNRKIEQESGTDVGKEVKVTSMSSFDQESAGKLEREDDQVPGDETEPVGTDPEAGPDDPFDPDDSFDPFAEGEEDEISQDTTEKEASEAIEGSDDIKSEEEAAEDNVEKEEKILAESKIDKATQASPVDKTTGKVLSPASRTLDKSGKVQMSAPVSKDKEKVPETVGMAKAESSAAEVTKRKSAKKKSVSRGKDFQSIIWMLPIAAALILAVMFFFHFESQILGHFRVPSTVDETVVTPSLEEDATIPEEEAVAQDDGVMAQELSETTEEEDSPFGLMGPEDEVLHGSFTIVLHSIVNENRARIEKAGFVEKGYKTTIWQVRHPNGSTTWRVGVGQFESVSDAEQAIPELPEPYRSNNFIIRIR